LSGILLQLKSFILTLIMGILAGLIFHFYQVTIRRAGIGRILLYMLDFFLWLIMICLVFLSLLLINQGEMRVYVFIALLLGILIYIRVFASRLEDFMSRIARVLLFLLSNLHKRLKNFLYIIKKRLMVMSKKRNGDPPENQGPE